MMPKTVASAALSIGGAILLMGAAAAGQTDFVRVKADVANLRSGPGTTTDPVLKAYENEPLQVVGRRDAWVQVVTFEGHRGWIYGPLTDDKPAVVVTGTVVNMRAGPGTIHEITFTAERGICFLVRDKKGDWLDVQHESGDRGWIHGSLVWGD